MFQNRMIALNDKLTEIIESQTTSIWLCNRNARLVPDVVRLMSARVEPDGQHVVAYVPGPSGSGVLANLAIAPRLTLLVGHIYTYEAYQVKGTYTGHRPSTPAEVQYQRAYVEKFAEGLVQQQLPREQIIAAYFHQPSFAVRLRVEEIYEQTPRKGTGERITL
jgi:hypothetical protein